MNLQVGLNKDITESVAPHFSAAQNVVADTSLVRYNERGTLELYNEPDTIYLGNVSNGNEAFVFYLTYLTKKFKIVYIDNAGTKTTILITQYASITANCLISGSIGYTANGNVFVVWTDQVNAPRYLCPAELPFEVDLTTYEIENGQYMVNLLDLQLPSPSVIYRLISYTLDTGSLAMGGYQIAIQYRTISNEYSPITNFSNTLTAYIRPSVSTDMQTFFDTYFYNPKRYTFTLELYNLAAYYNEFRVVIREYKNGKETYYIGDTYKYTGSTATVTVGKLSQFTLLPEEARIPRLAIKSCIDLKLLQDRVYIANIFYPSTVNIQKYVNNFSVKWTLSGYAPADNTDRVYTVFDRRTFMPNEVYAFYVVLHFKNGTKSPAYHVPGRTVKDTDRALFTTVTDPTDNETALNTSTNNQLLVYMLRDTSTYTVVGGKVKGITGAWENLHEFYPDDESSEVYDSNNAFRYSLQGLKVRHHRMPSVEKIRAATGTGYHNIQLYVENVYFPPEISGLIDYWELVAAKRNYNNHIILGSSPAVKIKTYGVDTVWKDSIVFTDGMLNEAQPAIVDCYLQRQVSLNYTTYADTLYKFETMGTAGRTPSLQNVWQIEKAEYTSERYNLYSIATPMFIGDTLRVTPKVIDSNRNLSRVNIYDEASMDIVDLCAIKYDLYFPLHDQEIVSLGNMNSPITSEGRCESGDAFIDIYPYFDSLDRQNQSYPSAAGVNMGIESAAPAPPIYTHNFAIIEAFNATSINTNDVDTSKEIQQLTNMSLTPQAPAVGDYIRITNVISGIDAAVTSYAVGSGVFCHKGKLIYYGNAAGCLQTCYKKVNVFNVNQLPDYLVEAAALNTVQPVIAYNPLITKRDDYPYRIHRTLQNNELKRNNIRQFLAADYKDIPTSSGMIKGIQNYGNALIVHATYTTYAYKHKDILETANANLYIASGDLFEREPMIITNRGGIFNVEARVLTNVKLEGSRLLAYIWVDDESKAVHCIIQEKEIVLSDIGMQSEFLALLNSVKNANGSHKVVVGFDEENNRLLVTIDNTIYLP